MKRREFLEVEYSRRPSVALPAAGQQRKKIAALSTTYHVRSHTDNFVTRFLEGYWINEKYYASPADIVSLYMDQIHPPTSGVRLSTAYDFRVTKSIAEALTLGSGKLGCRRRAARCASMAIIHSMTSSSSYIRVTNSSSR